MDNGDKSMGHNILTYRQECVTMTQEEQEAGEKEEMSTGPFSVLTDSVRSGMRILVNCTNNTLDGYTHILDKIKTCHNLSS